MEFGSAVAPSGATGAEPASPFADLKRSDRCGQALKISVILGDSVCIGMWT